MNKTETKNIIRWILALMVIVILFIPGIAVYEIEARTEAHVLNVEGLYNNGTVFSTYEPVNKTQVAHMYWGETIVLDQPNNDSFYYKAFPEDLAYTNFVNYIGNGTNSVTPNYTIHPTIPVINFMEIAIPLNITTHELAKFDFIRLISDDNHFGKYLVFNTAINGDHQYIYFEEVRNNTYLMIMTLSIKTWLLSSPNEYMYVFNTGIDRTDVSWNFKIIGFNLDKVHEFYWEDKQLYIVSLMLVAGILTPLMIFSSKFADLKFDRGKPGGKR